MVRQYCHYAGREVEDICGVMVVFAERCQDRYLSSIETWQRLLTLLLSQHYGLTLNDTPFSNETTIQEHIDAEVSLSDAVNFLVEKYELVRIDR